MIINFTMISYEISIDFNPFVPNASFLYPLKTSERFSDIFKGQRKGTLGMNVLKSTMTTKNVFAKLTVYKAPKKGTISCYDFENLTHF